MPGLLLYWFLLTLFIAPRTVFALRLQKFSSATSNDWVVLYNEASAAAVLGDYHLEDKVGNSKDNFSCFLKPAGYYRVALAHYLNHDGDIIFLRKGGEIVDCVAYGSEHCPNREKADIIAPDASQAAIFNNGSWQLTADISQPDNSDCLSPTSTPTPTLSPSPSPLPSPTLSPTATVSPRAICQLLAAHDYVGNTVSRAKIYVDGSYIHHYLPETLYFCANCYCDDDHQVACPLGRHQLLVRHDGFQPWQLTINFSAGQSYRYQPLLVALPSPASKPTLSPTPVLTAIASPSASPIATLVATAAASQTGEVAGISSSTAFPERNEISWPLVLIGGGLTLLGASWLLREKLAKLNDEV